MTDQAQLPFEADAPAPPGTPLDPRRWIQVVLEMWWVLAAFAGLAAAAAYLLTGHSPVTYMSKSVLQVDQEEPRLLSIEDVVQQDLRANEALNTIVANIKNSSVLRRVVQANSLTNDPRFLVGRHSLSEEQAIRSLDGHITAKLRKDTRLIDIIVTHPIAGEARKLADSVAREFVRHKFDEHYSTTAAANELLLQEVVELKSKLERSERQFQAYKEEHRMLSADEHENTVAEKLMGLNKSYTDAKAARLELEADWKQIQCLSNNVEALLTQRAVLSDPTIGALYKEVVEMEASVETLSHRYKPKYPAMAQAQRQLDDLRVSLDKLVLAVPRTLRASYEDAVAREQSLEVALRNAQQEALDLAQASIEYRVLQREVESDRALCDSVLQRIKETDVTKGLDKQSITIVEPASPPVKQTGLPRRLAAAGAAVVALALGLMALMVWCVLDGSIRSVDLAEQTLGLPVVASVPILKRAERKAIPLVVKHAESPAAEAFRTLRIAASSAGAHQPGSSCLFTSALPGEGKTLSSLNYAVCLAREGRETLLVDFDLRHSSLSQLLQTSREAPGLQAVLFGEGDLGALARPTAYPKLAFLPAGSPGEAYAPGLLTHEAVKKFLDAASRRFERIVIDSTPINCVGDTLLLLPAVTTVFLIVRAGATSRRAALRAVEVMARCQHPPQGVILNFMPSRTGFGFYYSYDVDYYGRFRAAAVNRGTGWSYSCPVMNSLSAQIQLLHHGPRPLPTGIWTALLLLSSGGACPAQEAIYQTGQSVSPEEAALAGPNLGEMLFKWGPVRVWPRADASAFYDSNIRLAPQAAGNDDEIFTFSPGVLLGLGDLQDKTGNLLALDYSPTFVLFSDHSQFNGIDQHLKFTGQWQTEKTTVGLEQTYESAEGGVRDVGNLAKWQIYMTLLKARYAYSPRTTFGLNAQQTISDWEGALLSYNEWRVDGYTDYSLNDKLSVGLGAGALWRNAQQNPDLVAELVNLRSSYQVSDKTLISASLGVESEQFQYGQNPGSTPILNVSGAYRIFERTALIFEAHRQTETSVNPDFAGQNVTVTGGSGGVRQEMWTGLTARATAGYEFADYGPIVEGIPATRQDNYVLVNASLDYRVTAHWTVGGFYTFRHNDSSADEYDFADHQVGVRTSYQF